MHTLQENEYTKNPPNENKYKTSRFRETVTSVVHKASLVTAAIAPVVNNLARDYAKLRLLSTIVNSVDAGLKEANEQVNERIGDRDGVRQITEG